MASQGASSDSVTIPIPCIEDELLSALEYEKAHSIQLQPFFDSSLPNIRHEEVKGWGEDLLRERHQEE